MGEHVVLAVARPALERTGAGLGIWSPVSAHTVVALSLILGER